MDDVWRLRNHAVHRLPINDMRAMVQSAVTGAYQLGDHIQALEIQAIVEGWFARERSQGLDNGMVVPRRHSH